MVCTCTCTWSARTNFVFLLFVFYPRSRIIILLLWRPPSSRDPLTTAAAAYLLYSHCMLCDAGGDYYANSRARVSMFCKHHRFRYCAHYTYSVFYDGSYLTLISRCIKCFYTAAGVMSLSKAGLKLNCIQRKYKRAVLSATPPHHHRLIIHINRTNQHSF